MARLQRSWLPPRPPLAAVGPSWPHRVKGDLLAGLTGPFPFEAKGVVLYEVNIGTSVKYAQGLCGAGACSHGQRAAPLEWRSVWLVGMFTGLRPGELQAMMWTDQNWPDFTANRIHVRVAYEAKSKVLGAPKTDRSMRDVDMVPTVRQVLKDLPRHPSGIIFPGSAGEMFARSNMARAWKRTLDGTGVRPIRPYDLRHTFASLLIAAGKNPLYVARQLGHFSAGFTLDTYGHLMESVPKRQVEWIDELVFPEGFAAALNLHLDGALRGASACSPVPSLEHGEGPEPASNETSRHTVQSGAAGRLVAGARYVQYQ